MLFVDDQLREEAQRREFNTLAGAHDWFFLKIGLAHWRFTLLDPGSHYHTIVRTRTDLRMPDGFQYSNLRAREAEGGSAIVYAYTDILFYTTPLKFYDLFGIESLLCTFFSASPIHMPMSTELFFDAIWPMHRYNSTDAKLLAPLVNFYIDARATLPTSCLPKNVYFHRRGINDGDIPSLYGIRGSSSKFLCGCKFAVDKYRKRMFWRDEVRTSIISPGTVVIICFLHRKITLI